MTSAVWKFPLHVREQLIVMPTGSGFLHVGEQDGDLFLWALVDPEAPRAERRVFVHATGEPITHNYDFFASVVMSNGEAWHVFDGEEVRS